MEKAEIDSWILRAYRALDCEGKGYLIKSDVLKILRDTGVYHHSSLQDFIKFFEQKEKKEPIKFREFSELTKGLIFLKRVLERNLIIPMFESFSKNYKMCFNQIKEEKEFQWGEIASYIPPLKLADPNWFATNFCSTNDQSTGYGDIAHRFSMQSISKVVAYSFLYELIGEDLHKWVGEEPSGDVFNAPVFDKEGRPHNPMVNAGSIMVCALIIMHHKGLDDLMDFYRKASDSKEVVLDENLYQEEKLTGHNNHALTSLMLAKRVFPQYGTERLTKESAEQALDLYFKQCSILVNVQSLARFGAMLANNGIIPSSGERILDPNTVQAVVTLMTTCGMYNGAGKFTKDWGVPSKSGVSGGLLTVIPGIGSFATFSPKLNKEGNSVRGIGIIKKMSSIYNNFNLFHKDLNKKDISRKPFQNLVTTTIAVCTCSFKGDLEELTRHFILGTSLKDGDYDNRTPLHLAASGGQLEVCKFLINHGVPKNPKDRWGATPLNDAKTEEVHEYLLTQGCVKGTTITTYKEVPTENVTEDQYRLYYSAFFNEVKLLKSLQVQGWRLNSYDYDGRTALAIAASEGHLASVKYLVVHGANIFIKDARGNNALDDAVRENRQPVIDYLLSVLEQARL